MSGLPPFITKKQLTQWMGWSSSTIERKVRTQCFPIYRFGPNNVRFRPEEILHYAEGCKEGSFERNGTPKVVLEEVL